MKLGLINLVANAILAPVVLEQGSGKTYGDAPKAPKGFFGSTPKKDEWQIPTTARQRAKSRQRRKLQKLSRKLNRLR